MSRDVAPRPTLDTRMAVHIGLTLGMAWLGGLLALPANTFAQGKGWRKFAEMATENTWAMAFWLAASIGVVGLTAAKPVLRLTSVLVLSSAYGCVALLMLWGSPAGSGSGTYTIMAGLGYYLAWRQARDGI